MTTLLVNGKTHKVDAPADTPLLWVLRDHIGLTGTKYGCGMATCGACTVHLDGAPVRACSTPMSAAVGKKVLTIEGLSSDNNHPVQKGMDRCGGSTVRLLPVGADHERGGVAR